MDQGSAVGGYSVGKPEVVVFLINFINSREIKEQ